MKITFKMVLGLFLVMPGSFILVGALINAVAAITGLNGLLVLGLTTLIGLGLIIANHRMK
jgi:hypothetical protein